MRLCGNTLELSQYPLTQETTQRNNMPKIDVNAIKNQVGNNEAYLIDVRENDEWSESHAAGATHLAVDRVMNGEVPTKDTSKKLYVYCASGGRASMAAAKLSSRGYHVENLGGLIDWTNAGGATESPS